MYSHQRSVCCPALFVAAPSSGVGKTTITAALARLAVKQGLRVRVFKTGPDYLDPQILQLASGEPVEQLDLWMAGEDYCRERLFLAAQQADLILIEGAMGLYDGNPSSADLAVLFGIPVTLVMDVKGMAQTCGALVLGLQMQNQQLQIRSIIANRCASQRHKQLVQDSLPASVSLLATFARDEQLALPERHLGLVQAQEAQDELQCCFDMGADALTVGGLDIAQVLAPVEVVAPIFATASIQQPLAGVRISVAKDVAFSFIYQANIDFLQELGAKLSFFSPLIDTVLPDCDALWLPGGYPELHCQQLQNNVSMLDSIRQFSAANKPILAECGGYLYCLQQLYDLDDQPFSMLGLLPGKAVMNGKRGCQGMQAWHHKALVMRGHAHHRSRSECSFPVHSFARRAHHPADGEPIYLKGNLLASYLHLYFASNLELTIALFKGELHDM